MRMCSTSAAILSVASGMARVEASRDRLGGARAPHGAG
jgi:hypothetical protein